MTSEVQGRVALVTGAASGIGLACARSLAAAGATVHVVDIDSESASQVADEIGGHPHFADLTDTAGSEALPSDVDILVNNAGSQHVAALPDFPPERFVAIQTLMVTAPFLLMRRCLPAMREKGWGRIVNISSVHGMRASPYKAAYVAAKHGLEGLSKVAAVEGAAYGVTSNCVAPGYVRTPLVEGQLDAQATEHGIDRDSVISDVLLQRAAIKRLIEPEDVASLVVWLCGPESAHITGVSIPVDGGWTAT